MQVAAVCEKVLQERDGVLSLIRVIDRLNVLAVGQASPEQLVGRLRPTLAVCLRSGDARGRHPVAIAVERPDGTSPDPQVFEVLFEGDDRGVNLIVNMDLDAVEGLYWFTVSVNGRELTKVPFRVIYQRMPTRG